jgi:hypothetical protein
MNAACLLAKPALASLVAALLFGCAAPPAPLAPTPGTSLGPDGQPVANDAHAPGATNDRVAGGSHPSAPSAPLPGGEEPTPDKALPELTVEALGMHVGGGKNDAEEKAPFHGALERQFPAFLDCYRLADDPWAGGSFGIDLKISRAGGAPQLEQPRTKIRGRGFQDCMLAAFSKTQFEKPKAGPTVISYSVRFTLGKRGAKP